MLMNELIMPHNIGVKKALENMEEVLALYKKVIGNYRPLLDSERYLTDKEVSQILKISRRTLQEYRNDGVLPYILLSGQVLYANKDEDVTNEGQIVVLELMDYDGLQFVLGQEFPFLAVGADVELRKRVTDKKPNYFFIPPKFAFSLKLNFPVFPVLPFIYGHSALIFQNPSFVTDFFRNFADKNRRSYSVSAKKETSFFVLLSTFRNFAPKR